MPGGSSSGAAVSVGDRMAVAALGTDTGGSVRIPAAVCGIIGFKPTARRVPIDGVVPLSTSLDSIGPLANSVECCAIVDAVFAGEPIAIPDAAPLAGLRFGIPKQFVMDELDPIVAKAFDRACKALSAKGVKVEQVDLPQLNELPAINAKGGFAASEAYAWHQKLLARRGKDYDPIIYPRILRGREMSAADYIDLLAARADLAKRVAGRDVELRRHHHADLRHRRADARRGLDARRFHQEEHAAAAQHHGRQLPRPLRHQPALPCRRRAAGRLHADGRGDGRQTRAGDGAQCCAAWWG